MDGAGGGGRAQVELRDLPQPQHRIGGDLGHARDAEAGGDRLHDRGGAADRPGPDPRDLPLLEEIELVGAGGGPVLADEDRAAPQITRVDRSARKRMIRGGDDDLGLLGDEHAVMTGVGPGVGSDHDADLSRVEQSQGFGGVVDPEVEVDVGVQARVLHQQPREYPFPRSRGPPDGQSAADRPVAEPAQLVHGLVVGVEDAPGVVQQHLTCTGGLQRA